MKGKYMMLSGLIQQASARRSWFACLVFYLMMVSGTTNAQGVVGNWFGTPNFGGIELPLELEVNYDGKLDVARLRSPLQSDTWMEADSVSVRGDSLYIEVRRLSLLLSASIKNDTLNGVVTQRGMPIAVELYRGVYPSLKDLRPQTPHPPYPYRVIDLTIDHRSDTAIDLAGTLTLPSGAGTYPVAILISGSGPQNRNEELLRHQPFKVIADYLTRQGIAVLRYDDRGVGASSGTHTGATSADFATDAASWLDYLLTRPDIASDQIGLIGHSEGGLIGAMVASERQEDVAFFISLAGPGIDGSTLLASQLHRKSVLDGVDSIRIAFEDVLYPQLLDAAAHTTDVDSLREQLQQILIERVRVAPAVVRETFGFQESAGLVAMLSDPWMMYFLQSDVTQYLTRLQCPVLAINGDKDYQVISDINLPGIEQALRVADNDDVTIVELADHNHLLQPCKTGSSTEYSRIRVTISEAVLETMSRWLLERF